MSDTEVVDNRGDVRSAGLLAQKLKDPLKLDEIRADPSKVDVLAKEAIEAANKVSGQNSYRRAFEADRQVYRYTVWFLGTAILLVVLGSIGLTIAKAVSATLGASTQIAIPDSLVAIASTAVGALAGLLSPIAISRSN